MKTSNIIHVMKSGPAYLGIALFMSCSDNSRGNRDPEVGVIHVRESHFPISPCVIAAETYAELSYSFTLQSPFWSYVYNRRSLEGRFFIEEYKKNPDKVVFILEPILDLRHRTDDGDAWDKLPIGQAIIRETLKSKLPLPEPPTKK